MFEIKLIHKEGFGALLIGDEYPSLEVETTCLWTGAVYKSSITNGQWCSLHTPSYLADYVIRFYNKGTFVQEIYPSYNNEICNIHFATGALGDTLCWMGSILKWFNKVKPSKLYVATSWNHIFDKGKYPKEFVWLDRPVDNMQRTHPEDAAYSHLLGITRTFEDRSNILKNHASVTDWSCFAKGTKVLMFDGTISCIEDIQEGDVVMGDNSTPRTVKQLYHGVDDLYKVTQSNNKPYIVNSRHIIVGNEYKRNSRTSNGRTFKGLFKMTAVDLFNYCNSVVQNRKYYGIKKGWQLKDSKVLRIDPYLLGFWLGDGSRGKIYPARKETSQICAYLDSIGYTFKVTPARGCDAVYVYGLDAQIQELGLSPNNMFIPKEYLESDLESRFSLLAGLIDSDGYYVNRAKGCNKYEIEISSKDRHLFNDIVYLTQSLGFTVYTYEFQRANRTNSNLRIVITNGEKEKLPILINHKKYRSSNRERVIGDSLLNVEYVGKGEYYGFTLEENPLFLLADGTVVHNCTNMSDTQNMTLGVELGNIYPHLKYLDSKRLHTRKYVTLCSYTTQKIKHILNNKTWMKLIRYIKSLGYDIISVGNQHTYFPEIIDGRSDDIEVAMRYIRDAEFHVGLSSGLSWMAWAYKKQVLMLGNFTHEGYEFIEGNTRVLNNTVSYGHFNNEHTEWLPSWDFDPDKDDLEQACRSITGEMTILGVNELLRKKATNCLVGTYLDVKDNNTFKTIKPLYPKVYPNLYNLDLIL
jgi:hypothetical protein